MNRRKILIPVGLLLLGLAFIVYPRVAGAPLTPVFQYENLGDYPVWGIPFVYIFSYATRAWGTLVFAFVLGGFFAAFISKERMMKYFSSKRAKNYFLAAALAPVFIVCSCAMIPILGGIMMAGAGIGPAVSFLLMAPAANVMALIFTSEIISPTLALGRLVFSFLGAVMIGAIIARTAWGREAEEKFGKAASERAVEIKQMKLDEKCWEAGKVAWDLAKRVVPYLLGGIAVVSFIEAYLSKDIVAAWLTGVKGVIIGGAVGVPTYTPTLVEVFFVKSLLNLGAASAAVLAFLIGAPMSSIPSMMGVSRIVGWKVVGTYAILAVAVAIIAGLCWLGLGVGL